MGHCDQMWGNNHHLLMPIFQRESLSIFNGGIKQGVGFEFEFQVTEDEAEYEDRVVMTDGEGRTRQGVVIIIFSPSLS